MIKLENVSKSFGRHKLLEGISFEISAGECVSLLGPGGCGKSTILKIILGLVEPDEGDVFIFGKNLKNVSEPEKRALLQDVGMAFQQGALFDFMTVRENLLFAMEHMRQYEEQAMESKVIDLLNGVKMPRAIDQFPYELSGGMQRRVGIARALATDPKLALFDEPTSGLDPVTSTIILNMIAELAGRGTDRAQLIATSNVEIAIRFADRVIMINESKVIADGPWRELIMNGPEFVKKFLSVRLIGLDREYAVGLDLPEEFIGEHWH